MSKRMVSKCVSTKLVALLVFTLSTAMAWQMRFGSVEGHIDSEGRDLAGPLYLELLSQGANQLGLSQRVPIESDGTFRVPALRPGAYMVKVLSASGNVLLETPYSYAPGSGQIELRLPVKRVERPVSGVISARLLRVPKKAQKAFDQAGRASEQGQTEEAVKLLEKAVRECPEFTEAYVNLGVQNFRLQRFPEGMAALEKAMSLGPETALLLSNYAYGLNVSGRYDEAQRVAQRAIDLDGSYPSAHYAMGFSLLKQQKPEAAIPELRKAASLIPGVRLDLAKIFVGLGKLGEATMELRSYLKEDRVSAESKKVVSGWLSKIESSLGPATVAGR
jgi:tetratricopeptide (TPR) repeat protein